MLTPSFEVAQDADFVIVRIRVPHLKADEGEFYVLDHEFKFHLRPYFLRLTFRHSLVEDGREHAQHDLDSGVLTIWLPKATPGEHFEGLHLLTELLRKPSKRAAPLIEVVGSSENGMCEDEGEGDDLDDLDDLGHLAEAEQQLPSLLTPGAPAAYGFNAAYSRVFVGLEEEGLVQLPRPDESTAESRRSARIAAEEAAFDADHYMADFMEDERAQAALQFVPWWRGPEAPTWRDADASGGLGSSGALGGSHGGRAGSGDGEAASSSAVDGQAVPFAMGSEYQSLLLQLPRKELLLDTMQRRRALCGLVDVLFAYAYDVRTTDGEPTVESGWTVRHVSATLSWLDCFDSVAEAAISSVRRSLCYPLVRHYALAAALLDDVGALLRLGRPAVLRALLDVRLAVQRSAEQAYLLNRLWLDDYCVWLQQLPARWLEKLADKLAGVAMSRELLGFPLRAYEDLALGHRAEEQHDESDDESSDVESSSEEDEARGADADVRMDDAGVLV